MDRRKFLGTALGSLLIGPHLALAQRAPRIWRIGILSFGSGFTASSATGANDPRSAVLVRAFEEQGYVEGKNVVYVARNAGGSIERLPELAAEVAGAGVDVIVTTGSEATQAAKRATATIPIVFLGPSYPVEEGLVASFARPGGNITGITLAHSDHVSKWLQLLRDVAPALADAAVIWDPDNPGNVFIVRDMESAAGLLQLKVRSVQIRSTKEVDSAIAAITQMRPGALIVMPSPVVFPLARQLGELAIKLRIPSIGPAKQLSGEGILLSYGADNRDLDRRVAVYVDRILKGAKPADLAVERPTKFELSVNMKTAKAIGLVIPPSMLLRADEVIR
jgi:putative ABC transport system substrate-binding protein